MNLDEFTPDNNGAGQLNQGQIIGGFFLKTNKILCRFWLNFRNDKAKSRTGAIFQTVLSLYGNDKVMRFSQCVIISSAKRLNALRAGLPVSVRGRLPTARIWRGTSYRVNSLRQRSFISAAFSGAPTYNKVKA